jgi:hypothetical protein
VLSFNICRVGNSRSMVLVYAASSRESDLIGLKNPPLSLSII